MADPASVLTDDERFPLIPEDRRHFLSTLREHAHAPRFNFRCGDRLTATGLEEVRRYERALAEQPRCWEPGTPPPWVRDFAARCLATVPFYRRRGGDADDLATIAPCSRSDLLREPEAFVPDGQPLDDMIIYDTSGTVGPVLRVPSHPVAAATYLPALRAVLARAGVSLDGGAGRVAIALVCKQARTLTYATLSAFLDGAAHVKVNLNPADWRDPGDAAAFLEACDPEVLTGDPFAFAALAGLPVSLRPKALVSTAMALLPAMRAKLQHRFRCPVLDVYSLTEARLIAVSYGDAHRVATHDVYVEILDAGGRPVPSGVRGNRRHHPRNPFQPLLRYRTGDYAALERQGDEMALTGLEGRAPVALHGTDGRLVNTIDVTHALRRFALPTFRLSQTRDHALVLEIPPEADADPADLTATLQVVFGESQAVKVSPLDPADCMQGKVRHYRSEIGF